MVSIKKGLFLLLTLITFVGVSSGLLGLPLIGVNYWYFEPLSPSQREMVVKVFKDLNLDIVRIGGLWYDAHGIDENILKNFFEFCNTLNATPLIQLPFNRIDREEARRFVEKVKTLWSGKMWWSIGNEMDIYTDLWKEKVFSWIEPMSMSEAFGKFGEFLRILEDAGEKVVFAPDYSWKWRPWWRHDWISPFMRRFSSRIDVLALHRYPFDEPKSVKQIMDDVEFFTDEIKRLRKIFPRHPISITETNLTWNWNYRGEFDGQSYWAGLWFIAMYGRAVYLNLHSVLFWSAVNDKTLSLITVKGSRISLHPTYHALKFWSDVKGELKECRLSREWDYYVFETRRLRTVVVVNKSSKDLTVKVSEVLPISLQPYMAVKLVIDRESGTVKSKETFSRQASFY